MDGFSAAASIIAVIQISGQVIDSCHKYYSLVKNARTDIQRLRDEMVSLQDVLSKLADLAKSPGPTELSVFGLLNQPDGPVQQCLNDSIALVAKLKPGQGMGEMRQFGWRALKWPFSSKEVDKAITAIGRHKATFILALARDQTALALAINQGVIEGVAELRQLSETTQIAVAATRAEVGAARTDVAVTRADIIAHRTDEYREKIIQWLSTTDPSSNYHAARKKRQPTTGEWLFKRPEFEEWKRTRNSLLWLHGILFGRGSSLLCLYLKLLQKVSDHTLTVIAGCGKTILSSTIIEHVEAYCKAEPGLANAYFYFDFNDIEKQNTANCVSSLLAQLCRETVVLPETLKDLYKRCNEGKSNAGMHSLIGILRHFAAAGELQDIFIVVDALDECPEDDGKELRNELLDLIAEIRSWSTSNTHLLVTSRQEPDIKEKLVPLLTAPAISIAGSEVEGDIEKHIENQLATDPKLKGWSDDLKVHIERTLAEKANGMFRWVFCQLDALKRCRKKKALLEALGTLPKTLDDTYERILMSIEKNYQKEARRALIWLAFSQRPLRIEELAEAAVVDPNVSPPFDPEERLHDPCNEIIEILGSLVTISSRRVFRSDEDDYWAYDSDVTTDDRGLDLRYLTVKEIRLAHFSVKEYLLSDRIGTSSVSEFRATSVEADQFISHSCLLYIFHYDKSDSRTTTSKDLKYFPLLHYACKFWYSHARSIPEGSRESVDPVILGLFLSDTALFAWLQVYRPGYFFGPFDMPQEVGSHFYYASWIGSEAVVQRLLEYKIDADAKGNDGQTALHVAAGRGDKAIVLLLLEYQADVDVKDDDGQTALHYAALSGYRAVVQLLLEYKANINAQTNYGRTALYNAVNTGQEAVVRWLLEYKTEINAKDMDGRITLHVAADWGDKAIVQLLLEYQADVDAKDHKGRTALYYAALWGYEAVIQRVLEYKADINAQNNNGRTALHSAAYNGYEEVMRRLLEYKADTNAKDMDGRTALHLAASEGRETVMRQLLEYQADIDAKDHEGWTALHYAAYWGYEAVVRLLLDYKADVDTKNISGNTALDLAAPRGHEVIIRLLETKKESQ